MTLVSEALRIKSNIANAYASAESKGATLPEVQNSDYLAECIDSITGGGDVVYAINQSSSIPEGKVLVRQGQAGGQEYVNDIFSTKATIEAKGWYDDNTIIGSFLNKENRRIRYVDNSWQEEVLTTMTPKTGNTYNFFWTTSNGKVMSRNFFTYNYNNPAGQEYFITPEGFSLVNNGACTGYLGEYNGVHYGYKDRENDVYVYNIDSGTYASSSFINGPSTRNIAFLEDNKILLIAQTATHDYRMYELNEDGSYTTLNSDGRYNSSYSILKIFGVTGLEIGDYVLALDDGDSTTTRVLSSISNLTYSNACKLVLLQITDGYVLTPVSLPMLEQFETVDCRISYDRRNQVLMIGTKLGVFAYQFNSGTKTFSEMPINLGLPAVTMGTVYCPYMSPNKKRILVTLPMSGVANDAGDYAEKIWIYQLSEEGWFIVDNRTLNYQPRTVFTGIATGNVDESGKYEVNLGSLLVEDSEGGSSSKYGLNLGSILGDIDENGVLQPPSEESELVFKGMVKGIGGSFPLYFLEGNNNITGVHFPDMEVIEKVNDESNFLYQAFNSSNGKGKIKSFSCPKLKRIVNTRGNGFSALVNCFNYQYEFTQDIEFPELEEIIDSKIIAFNRANSTKISLPKFRRITGFYASIDFSSLPEVTSVDLGSLEEIGRPLYTSNSVLRLYDLFKLEELSFPKLKTILGKINFAYCGLKNIYFNALTNDSFNSYTDVFNNMLQGVTGCTVHFPSNLESTISTWSDVTAGFGGTDTIILFDLEPTE